MCGMKNNSTGQEHDLMSFMLVCLDMAHHWLMTFLGLIAQKLSVDVILIFSGFCSRTMPHTTLAASHYPLGA